MDKVAEAVGKALKVHPGSAAANPASHQMPGAAALPGSDDADASRRRCATVIPYRCSYHFIHQGINCLLAPFVGSVEFVRWRRGSGPGKLQRHIWTLKHLTARLMARRLLPEAQRQLDELFLLLVCLRGTCTSVLGSRSICPTAVLCKCSCSFCCNFKYERRAAAGRMQ